MNDDRLAVGTIPRRYPAIVPRINVITKSSRHEARVASWRKWGVKPGGRHEIYWVGRTRPSLVFAYSPSRAFSFVGSWLPRLS